MNNTPNDKWQMLCGVGFHAGDVIAYMKGTKLKLTEAVSAMFDNHFGMD